MVLPEDVDDYADVMGAALTGEVQAAVVQGGPAATLHREDAPGTTVTVSAPEASAASVSVVPASIAPARPPIDEALRALLREEAEREVSARRAEATRGIETQTELDLPATAPGLTVRQVGADIPEDELPRAAQRSGARRDLLPDIEEINSTLRAGNEARGDVAPVVAEPAAGSGGFRTGFVAMLAIAAVLVALYIMAPRIAQHLPGSAPAMARYVEIVTDLRLQLDRTIAGAVTGLKGLTGQDG